MHSRNYKCPKCGGTSCTQDQLQATGGTMAKLFDIQDKKFITISCSRCGYTELYKEVSDEGMNVLDFLFG